ncbi:MAG: haloalkane dehalogenase [Pseudomonadota bacterium]
MNYLTRTLFLLFVILLIVGCSSDGDSSSEPVSEGDGSMNDEMIATAACDAPVERMLASNGVEFVRTPDSCFENLVDFPYESQYVDIDGLRQAYVEDGPDDGEVVLLLHGQPSWSYLYRKMIPVLADGGYRVIAMDHLGTGRSDKPTSIDDYTYTVHSDRLERFITSLGLSDINLFVQDWGSLIGLKVAGENPDWFASIAVGDGALPSVPEGVEVFPRIENPDEIIDIPSPFAGIPDQQEPFYDGCELLIDAPEGSGFGSWMEYAMKAESFHASEVLEANTWFPLSDAEEAAYDAPFPTRDYMAGIRKFPSIVNELGGQTDEAIAGLARFGKPFLTIWASNDFGNLGSCEAQQFFIDLVPGAAGQAHTRLPEASHFLQDDQGPEIALRLIDFMMNPAPVPSVTVDPGDEPVLAFELFQTVSENETRVWINSTMTQEEFDALELPEGWRKNLPRESSTTGGEFSRSPGALENGPLTQTEWFGYSWQHNATVLEAGLALDDEQLLNAAYVAKHHTIAFDAGTSVYVLVSPEGEQYLRVSRDPARSSDEPSIPADWRLVELELTSPLSLTLPNPTLNIRADNLDSFQGPVNVLTSAELEGGAAAFSDGPIPLSADLCEDPSNMDTILESPMFSAILAGGGVNGDQVQRMIDEPTAGPFYMFNLIHFRELAVYADGRDSDLTGQEANALYSPTEFLSAIGARPVLVAPVDDQIDGDEPQWDEVAIVEYPCPVAFFAMLTDPGFQERLVHKDAGVETTWVIVTLLEPSLLPAELPATESPFPPSQDDPAFELIHVMDFRDNAQYETAANEPARTGEEAWDLYAEASETAGREIGSWPTARLKVQGVFSGDQRSWDEIDIDYMPSLSGFEAFLDDESRREALFHRDAALAGNYSLITFPEFNEIPGAPDVNDGLGTGSAERLPVTDLGVGKVCMSDADCAGIGTCLSDGIAAGFCTRQCGAGECGNSYLCCHSCSASVAAQLPFNDSACLPGDISDQLKGAPASCACE